MANACTEGCGWCGACTDANEERELPEEREPDEAVSAPVTRRVSAPGTHWRFKHGEWGTLIYHVWRGMQARCHNPKDKSYHRYGGRGIIVCARWRSDFTLFRDDMGPRPEGSSLERIDNSGNYCPENCRWATPLEQAHNRRSNVFLTIDGETLTQAEWCRRIGISGAGLRARIRRGLIGEQLTSPGGRK